MLIMHSTIQVDIYLCTLMNFKFHTTAIHCNTAVIAEREGAREGARGVASAKIGNCKTAIFYFICAVTLTAFCFRLQEIYCQNNNK